MTTDIETRSEDEVVAALAASFAGGGYRMPDLMRAIVNDAAFRYVGGLR